MLAARIGTAAVFIAILLAGLFLLPRLGVTLLIAVIVAVGGFEWARLCKRAPTAAGFYAAVVTAAFVACAFISAPQPVFIAAAAFWVVAAPAWLWRGVKPQHAAVLLAGGFLVLVPAALAVVSLPPLEALLALGVVWIADTAAYFAGRRWGRHKLAASISPGKTWEGVAGALLAGGAYAMILALLHAGAQGKTMAAFLGAAALFIAASIVGDLFESAAKRQAGVKDSGTILPGHGGMLDRIDSATATLPFVALIVPFLR